MKPYDEASFEAAIELHLTQNDYVKRRSEHFDKEVALDTQLFCDFVRESQPQAWDYLESFHRDKVGEVLIKNLVEALNSDQQGSLHVLRDGFRCYGRDIKAVFFKPPSGMNEETQRQHQCNRFSVTRQVHYSKKHNKSVDVLLCINGIPVLTMELKNPLTGQNYRHAIAQYKQERSPSELLFEFKKRALVHFAVDPNEVYMTTKLAGVNTVFLPFNKGRNNGAGNPDNPDGHKTAYLWQQVLARDSLLEIVGKFLHLHRSSGDETEVMIFPRYHQWHLVQTLLTTARAEGPGHNYLIQHSAGSGKSHSIAWTAHRLISLHDKKNQKIFSAVIVVSDRKVLDRQLQDTVHQFEHVAGLVQSIDKDSTQLAEALNRTNGIIITTIQKFPFVVQKVGELINKTYAVIVDEAHSSMTSNSAEDMKSVLGTPRSVENKEQEEYTSHEIALIEAIKNRKGRSNISFFAFTATPKYKTLHIFKRQSAKGAENAVAPFHLYSMKQAIEEGFIVNVLKNYITYNTYFKLIKSTVDDPLMDKQPARKVLAGFVAHHAHNIEQKVKVIIEHFRNCVVHKLRGQAKAMVVVRGRKAAMLYKKAIDAYLRERGYENIKALVAFSGTLYHEGATYTEVAMNGGVGEKELPKKFEGDEYNMLIVAEKYQTGFDQPRLCAMYVDKRLGGVQAVQTLSRLNRTFRGKTETFILDFVNSHEEIRKAFQPYYEETVAKDDIDYKKLYEFEAALKKFYVYFENEVEDFLTLCRGTPRENLNEHAEIHSILDVAVSRFNALENAQRENFVHTLVAFRNLYVFLVQIMPFEDLKLEKLCTYLRFLHSALPKRDAHSMPYLDDDVELEYYRLQKMHEEAIALEAGEQSPVYGHSDGAPVPVEEKKQPLSEIIRSINETHGTEFTEEDERVIHSIREIIMKNTLIQDAARANTLENFQIVFFDEMKNVFEQRINKNEKITREFLNTETLQKSIVHSLSENIYKQIRKGYMHTN